MKMPLGEGRTPPVRGEDGYSIRPAPDQTPRQDAKALEARIRHHAEAAGDWADSAREIQDNDLTFVFAAVAQAHAAAAQALALLRRSTTVEVLR